MMQVGLLTRDVGHTDPALLQQAANDWALSERFMPKAVDLLALVQKHKTPGGINLQKHVDYGNAHLASIGRTDCRWVIRNNQVVIELV